MRQNLHPFARAALRAFTQYVYPKLPYDAQEDPQEYENLWLHQGNESLKLAQMKVHMDALMATVDVGPPRFVND